MVADRLDDAMVGRMRDMKWVPVAVIASALAVSACQPDEVAENQAVNEVSPRPRLPVAEPPMDRRALLMAVAEGASAAALGQDDSDHQRDLDGKRFEIRVRFGCAAQPVAKDDDTGKRNAPAQARPFNVRFNSDDRTLRLRAAPDLTLDDPRIAAIAGEDVEAVEGFWMRRPWLLADGCPAEPPPATGENEADATQGSSSQRVGLAQFFTEADSRTARRDNRAYEATEVLDENRMPSRTGYNLILSGRLRQLPNGRVITCYSVGTEAPPECVVAADFDRVWIEEPGSKDVIAEWSS